MLQCLCLGISCGFTTAYTFPFSKLRKAKVSGTHGLKDSSHLLNCCPRISSLERIGMQNTEGLDGEKEDGKKEKKNSHTVKSIKRRNMWEQRRIVVGGIQK